MVTQGNGVQTTYSYEASTRRLSNLNAVRQSNTIFQNLSYSYDRVGNVLALKNSVDLPQANEYGGPSFQRFEYDDLYRLTRGQGVFPANVNATAPDVNACAGVPTSHCRVYSVDLTYDTIHNITRKTQADTRYPPGGSAVVQKKTTYDFPYAYNASGPGSVRPHAPNHIDVRSYTYDANGNQLGWTHDTNGTARTIVWDDENRIQEVSDNGHTKTYKYDDHGNRVIKRGPQGETVYVNQFYTQRPGATGTKHIYAGTMRIASKLLRQDAPNANPNGKTPFEKDIYFYHPDHLGSSSYITDLNGKLYEALIYFPFGEGWIEENTNVQRTPFHFTAKELDEETGLYYFGARYYDPRTSVWQSGDPILWKYLPSATTQREQKLPGIGGIYSSRNLSLFSYAALNPLSIVDPDGNEPVMNQVGMAGGFRSVVLDNSPNKVGLQTGAQAQATLQSWGGTEWTRKGPMPTTTYFNTATIRYVYTKSGGWIDMSHFTFYAGLANKMKQQGSSNPVGETMQRGYWQEASDVVRAPWSAYSYEDLPSDRLGAIFGAYVFDPTKKETLGEQIESFLNLWGADSPLIAPNINALPMNDAEARKAYDNATPDQRRAKQNRAATPQFTLPDPAAGP